jgi:hypothetical protein
VRVDGEDDVDGVEDAGEVAEDGEQHADPELQLFPNRKKKNQGLQRELSKESELEEGGRAGGTDGAAAVTDADAERREEDGAQELQAPAAARAQAHLLLVRPRDGCQLLLSCLRLRSSRTLLAPGIRGFPVAERGRGPGISMQQRAPVSLFSSSGRNFTTARDSEARSACNLNLHLGSTGGSQCQPMEVSRLRSALGLKISFALHVGDLSNNKVDRVTQGMCLFYLFYLLLLKKK